LGHDDDDDDKDDDCHTATKTAAVARVEERHTIIQALQCAGVFGICSRDDYDDNDDIIDHVEGDDSDQTNGENMASKQKFPTPSAVETSTREQRESFVSPFPTDHSIRDAA
jgi:hypothetical protein